MKDVHQKSNKMPAQATDASLASSELLLASLSNSSLFAGSRRNGANYSIATMSLALSFSATGLFVAEPQMVQATEAATLENSQTGHLFSQGENPMIPAPVTLATPPEVQPVVESSQLVAAVSPSSQRIEPALPAIKHVVAEDETIWSIAQRYGVSVEAIAALNNISTGATLTLGQSIKIPTHLSQPIAAVPEQLSSPRVTAEVAALQPTKRVLAEKENSLKTQEDGAIAALRAKQQNLAKSVEQLRDQSTEVVFDADEAKVKSSETLISSAALTTQDESVAASSDSVTIPVPLPSQAKAKVQAGTTVIASEALIANNALASSSRLPEPPSLRLPAPELVAPTQEQRSISVTVPTVQTIASQPTNTVEAKPNNEAVIVPSVEVATTGSQSPDSPFLVASAPAQTHTVRSGETLYAIARRYGVAGRDLITVNRLDNPNQIKVNQQLLIPGQLRAVSSPSQFVSLLPRTEVTQSVNRDSQTLANAPTLATANQEEDVALAFEITAESAVNRLKADITRMRQDYQQQRAAESPKTPVVEFTLNNNTASSVAVNPEWQGKSPAIRAETAAVNETNVAAATQEVELAAASQENITNYNSLLRMSVGEVVAPELPPLASPGEYLPGSEVFNGYIWPAKGVLTSGYGRRWGKMHKGIDIAAPVGTPIFAAAGGEVVSAGWNSGGYGNLVKIKHDDESVTVYAHNSRILVRNGQQVKQGQQIAAMGSTGFSTGPHLHFEVHQAGAGATNPIAYLPKS